MNATPPNPSRTLRLFAAAVKWSLWLLLAAGLLMALAWGALHEFIVPRIGELRPALELRASQVLGVPVRIGRISARSEGLIPSFTFQDVELLDAQGRAALTLPTVVAALSPRSLWNLGFEQLYIDQPRVDIRRDRGGRIFVGGLDLSRSSDNEGRAADWFFNQTEVVLQGGWIQWTDEQRGAAPLVLSQVDFVARNARNRHMLRLDATPPRDWGKRFTLVGLFRQPLLSSHPGRWQQWSGQVHADFAWVDLSQLRQQADLGIDIAQGRGRLRAWADVSQGQVVGGTADVALTDVSATLGPQLQPLELQSVSGRVGGKRLATGFELKTEDLQFLTRDGQRWPGGNVALAWTEAEGDAPARGELQADRLDLGALSQVAARLPLDATTHAALQAYAPRGLVESVQARWQGPLEAPLKYEAHGRAVRLELASRPGGDGHAASPGVRGAALDFDLTQTGGKARVAIAQGALEFPGVFEDPVLPLDKLDADVQWQLEGDQIAVRVDKARFSNADAEGDLRASWHTGDPRKQAGARRLPGRLDLQGSLRRADGTRVWRYLPLGVPKAARDYVHASVQAGRASGVKFRVRGDLQRFPFADNKGGEFLVTAPVTDVDFAYVPRTGQRGPQSWPPLAQLTGELVFQGNGMQVKGVRGQVKGLPHLQVQADATIPDFHSPQVQVQGKIAGPVADALAVVNTSPAGGMINHALARTTANGSAEVGLRLALPLHDVSRSQVQGTVTLAGNDVQLSPDTPWLARSRGVVQFSDKGFQLAGVQARALGGDVRLEGGTRTVNGESSVQLRAQGTVTAEGLRQARELGPVARLARDLNGSAGYNLAIAFRRDTPEVQLTSNLQGMAIHLPAPLAKAADTALPLRFETALTRDSLAPGARLQELLSVDLGKLVSVAFVRDLGTPEPQLLRGTIAVGLSPGESVTMPAEGVAANVQLGRIDVDAWQNALARITGAEGTPGANAPGAARADSGSAGMGYLPATLALRARELSVSGHTLHNVVIGGSLDARTWRANVDAQEANGYVEYRQPQSAGFGRLYARLARMNMADSAASDVENLLEQQPANIPALDVMVEDFELKGRKLGRLEIDAVNRGAGPAAAGAAREWRLNKLALTTPEASFTASGNWAALGAQAGGARSSEQRRTSMKFRLDIADAGQALARFGMKDVVRRGRGAMEGTVSWLGSPMALDYPSLTGNFHLDVENGQFLKAQPGLGKLLSVLSLQSLPRRLTLDFRDVFSQGFAFDFVRGDVAIDQGIAATNNLQMKGVNAAVLMEGKADLAHETQDLKVVVVPEINAGTASLVATAINPAIGLGTFLAQMFLREPLMKAATQEFHVDGTWADPRVVHVDRNATASARGIAPAAEPPAR
ncbi:TIGR02099 family protein [Ramlibacter ginsenosidimutans]|uniref:TIGR02099 family protein n=1 Tax=Ramlibacter ginsenosidimutans TaxID=502333 RepID=A0A934TQN6_9BURK|nr:YhdP family protein [Ramlibacter ginsenosidimutans]MBK6005786.1 TIGR02099 family protein [Ramlibacter ginsenosidimutans]